MHSLTSDENPWGTPSKVYFSDKPLLEGSTDLQSVEWEELDLNVEVPHFSPFDAVFPLEQEDSGDAFDWASFMSGEPITLNFTIDAKTAQSLRNIVRCPKLPRKLKKYVKKHYFDEYPKRVSAQMLRFAFAVNNPRKAGRVGLHIGVDVSNDGDSGKEKPISTTSCTGD